MAQSGYGKIRIFEDFTGPEVPVALTTDFENIGPFLSGGEGIEDNDAGIVRLDTDANNGVVRLVSANVAKDTTAVFTGQMFVAGTMGQLACEARVRMPDLDDKAVFIGFADANDDDINGADDLLERASNTTFTLNGSNFCGFFWHSEVEVADEDWYGVFRGGDTTGVTAAANVDLDADATLGEFQVLRLEIETNGTARWYVDGVLKQTQTGAVSTTDELAFLCAVTATDTEFGHLEVDYLAVEANRDWTV
tara:strand:+ start:301 stop:1050 length:750 start_codon:yes stop_codon:yes gene_type:complete